MDIAVEVLLSVFETANSVVVEVDEVSAPVALSALGSVAM
jgi:hypothetical protein